MSHRLGDIGHGFGFVNKEVLEEAYKVMIDALSNDPSTRRKSCAVAGAGRSIRSFRASARVSARA
jgi:hypothetical protein